MIVNVNLGQQVRIVNVDSRDWTFAWDSDNYTLPLGGEIFMPFDGAKVYFGDPRSSAIVAHAKDSRGVDMFIPDRLSEVRRLWQLFPPSNMSPREMIPGMDASIMISDTAPKVQMYTLAGDRIYTVLDDPRGDQVIAADSRTVSEDAFWKAAYLKQQQELDAIKAMLGMDTSPSNDDDDDDDDASESIDNIPEDRADNMMNSRPELAKVAPRPESRPVIKSSPEMVFDPKKKRVVERKSNVPDPTTIDSLPEDA